VEEYLEPLGREDVMEVLSPNPLWWLVRDLAARPGLPLGLQEPLWLSLLSLLAA